MQGSAGSSFHQPSVALNNSPEKPLRVRRGPMRSNDDFPWCEFDAMLSALLTHAEHLSARLCAAERKHELIRIVVSLELAGCQRQTCAPWKDAVTLHMLLLECIQRQRSRVDFKDDVALMLAATEGFEQFRSEPQTFH
jgi:hypothetical protein